MSLRISERKWFNKTVAAFQHHWLANFRSARSTDNFVRGIARATGLPASTIRKSLPFKNFRAAQRDGKSYLALALKNIRAAFKAGTWRKNYLRAFGGAGAGVARPKRKKRKTKKKSPKKKGGKKKIYGTKSAAKKAATKGRYPYKVKGGWSLSKKAKKKKSTKKKSTKKKSTKKKSTKKKSTKKKSTKKKGRTTKKKIYGTKSAAKKAATKGRYPYKVKGGWCLSKKR